MMRISAQALTSAASPPLLGLGETTAAPLFAPGESGDTYPYRLAKQHHSPLPQMALARLDLMRILSEADGSFAGPWLRAFDDAASLCRCITTIHGLTWEGRVFGLLCRSRSSWCLLRCGRRCYALVVVFDPPLFDNPWAPDLFPTVAAIIRRVHVWASCRASRWTFKPCCRQGAGPSPAAATSREMSI